MQVEKGESRRQRSEVLDGIRYGSEARSSLCRTRGTPSDHAGAMERRAREARSTVDHAPAHWKGERTGMPRERRGERVLGPHFIAERNGWRLTYVYADGSRSSSPIFPSEEEARREKQR